MPRCWPWFSRLILRVQTARSVADPIDSADQIVVEADQILFGMSLFTNEISYLQDVPCRRFKVLNRAVIIDRSA
jgi:hypothetical protein